MNNQQDYPTDVLPEDRKQERIVELERKLKQAEARLADAVKELAEMEKIWQLAYAGRECPQCGKWVTMNNDPADVLAAAALERLEVKGDVDGR